MRRALIAAVVAGLLTAGGAAASEGQCVALSTTYQRNVKTEWGLGFVVHGDTGRVTGIPASGFYSVAWDRVSIPAVDGFAAEVDDPARVSTAHITKVRCRSAYDVRTPQD